jgi:hypothetical protein
MAAESKNPIESPFHVTTEEGIFHSGYVDEYTAKSQMQILNRTAAEMDIKTRYMVSARPPRA